MIFLLLDLFLLKLLLILILFKLILLSFKVYEKFYEILELTPFYVNFE